MRIGIEEFRGHIPRVNPRSLPTKHAQLSQNARMLSGALEPWRDTEFTSDLTKTIPPTLVAVSSGDQSVIRSTDHGATWTQVASVLPAGLFSAGLAYSTSRNRLVVTANVNSNWVATSDDKGLTWTARGRPLSVSIGFGDVAHSESLDLFVALRSNPNGYVWSADGVTWTVGTMPAGLDVFDPPGWSEALGFFVATAYNTGTDTVYLLKSVDGKTWTGTALVTRPTMVQWAAGGGVLCGVGLTRDAFGARVNPKQTLTTAAGIAATVTDVQAKSDAGFGSVCRSDRLGLFVAGLTNVIAGLSTQNILTSTDGNTWTTRVLPGLQSLNRAVHTLVDDGTNVVTLGACPNTNNAGNISTDALTWTRIATPAGITCRYMVCIP